MSPRVRGAATRRATVMRAPFAWMGRYAAVAVVVTLLVAWPDRVSAKTLSEAFADANAAYTRGDYEAARAGYEELVYAYGVDDPDVTFNLATANAQLRRYGHAIRWYERTLRLRPHDEGAQTAIAAARSLVGNRRAQAEGEAAIDTRPPFTEAVVRGIDENTLALLVLALDALFFGVLIVRRRSSREAARLALGIAAPMLGLLLAGSLFALSAKRGWLDAGEPAVVLDDRVALRDGPSGFRPESARAREGDAVRLLDRSGAFVKVRLASGKTGWVLARAIGPVDRSSPPR